MNYELQRLSSADFEDLAQALALKVLGNGLSIFGSGPDGGREATFDGPVPIDTDSGPWNGYGIIQVKAKEEITTPAADAKWLIGELKKEFSRWLEKPSKSRAPQYYIIVTNVKLSGVEDTGGMDKVGKELGQLGDQINLKGFRVWHHEHICRMLDDAHAIRRNYRAWITPGDVLANVLDELEGKDKDFMVTMESYLAREFSEEKNVNMRESGSASDDPTNLADVMIDLPLKKGMRVQDDATVLHTLISVADACQSAPSSIESENVAGAQRNRFVLVGGPGQGKSTVSQWLCQVYRCALLESRPPNGASELKKLSARVRSQVAAERLPFPTARRWPFRINLTQIADAISEGKAVSVLDFLAQRINKRMATSYTASDLRRWLGEYPWFVVLDGLDEVPVTSNRAAILRCVEDFWIDAAAVNGDVILVATTRPQGYTEEFSPDFYIHLELSPLGQDEASYYFRRLIDNKISDPDRRELVTRRFDRALSEPNTAHLMRSPLQVTIMSVLLERIGEPPRERYSLFKEYYRVIYQRELEKDTLASHALRDYQTEVDAIHAYFGLQLQIRGQEDGGAESVMSEDDFRNLVLKRLESEEYDNTEALDLANILINSALERLVFIVPVGIDNFGFEIRSLQEFMAAEAILDGTDDEIAGRLLDIGSSSYWRNVCLFAAGKILSSRQALRPRLLEVCAELNAGISDEYDFSRVTYAGSRLAIDILRDGSANRQPRPKRLLTDLAAQALALPPNEAQNSLSLARDNSALPLIDAKVREVLDQKDGISRLGTWNYLGFCADSGDEASYRILSEEYKQLDDVLRLEFATLGLVTGSVSLVLQALPTIQSQPLEDVLRRIRSPRSNFRSFSSSSRRDRSSTLEWLKFLTSEELNDGQDSNFNVVTSGGRLTNFSFRLCAVKDESQQLEGLISEGIPNRWIPFRDVISFSAEPSSKGLEHALSRLKQSKDSWEGLKGFFPWVVNLGYFEMLQNPDLTPAEIVERLGGPTKWELLETKWRKGVKAGDLIRPDSSKSSIDYVINEGKFPLEAVNGIAYGGDDESGKKEIGRALENNQINKHILAISYLFIAECRANELIPLGSIRNAIKSADMEESWKLAPGGATHRLLSEKSLDVPVLNEIGNKCNHYPHFGSAVRAAIDISRIFAAWIEAPEHSGLLRLAFSLYGHGVDAPIPVEQLRAHEQEMGRQVRVISILLRLLAGDLSAFDDLVRHIEKDEDDDLLRSFVVRLPLPNGTAGKMIWWRLCNSQAISWQARAILMDRAVDASSASMVSKNRLRTLL
ncbi:NACHT domain-containing protein [Streptosporangium sp. NPDC049376]|uniref:NACHT domain-containing protein n=1 Tax=Streptosporangium sp. NPDC049376 TaxID=3366192 RepID=UPI00379D5625